MAIFNPFDIDRWRAVLRDFDAKRDAFYATLNELRQPVPDPALDAARRALLARAAPLQAELEKTVRSLSSVRDVLRNIAKYFTSTGAAQTLGAAFVPFVVVGVGIVTVGFVIAKITDWLKDADKWKTVRAQMAADWTPEEIRDAQAAAPKEQPKLFGMDMGALKWVAIIGGVVIAGPYVVREIEKRMA